MDLMDEIKKRSVYVDKGIGEFLPISHPEELYRASRYLPDAGGKRLRPAVLMLSTEAVGGDPMSVIPAAVALELVHNFTLVHDDIMDNDDVRRGMPAVHVKWGSEGAILAGDTLYSKAFEILSVMEKDPERILKCVALLSRTCTEICEGQWMDIEFENRDTVSEEEYLEMVEKKTSVLYGAAAKVGALLGGASDEVADAMYEFGRLVGISFQIQDDVIDMVTPEDILGKVRGSDLIEGKRTLIAIHALNHGVELEIFGKGGSVSPEQIDEAVSILEDSGSIKYAQDLSTETLERGKRMLDILGDSEAKEILLAVADYMVTRNY
ncbi:polyprenyl synthetase family protein [Methanococcoides burtonii]|uniref:Bifunctional short chain isoprenyl diphosphate synthase n=1 Tax=Methanococcoides burtonii (strain DSM 6242 / NBRC 107633 / OCM 468 / ACE-M) TaxID=259564 RepID=Q12TH6_METBU|nr:polyprenyl synthetase family protein [Methanococcoides burtonii]ABE53250.1 Bifunctional short chain isoprenyl diphosphate synthase [Methanococcoides burtonii DSM 6242]